MSWRVALEAKIGRFSLASRKRMYSRNKTMYHNAFHSTSGPPGGTLYEKAEQMTTICLLENVAYRRGGRSWPPQDSPSYSPEYIACNDIVFELDRNHRLSSQPRRCQDTFKTQNLTSRRPYSRKSKNHHIKLSCNLILRKAQEGTSSHLKNVRNTDVESDGLFFRQVSAATTDNAIPYEPN